LDERGITVKLARSGKWIAVPAERTVLESLLAASVDVPHECKRGECGLCATAFVEGEPDHRDLCLTPGERQQSLCVCVSRAKSETLVLDC
ncbi:MAG: 2Fe-2S iron-sulfur cluster binding domain-containing protein, partial [Candidatus Latescibacterota bacterium]